MLQLRAIIRKQAALFLSLDQFQHPLLRLGRRVKSNDVFRCRTRCEELDNLKVRWTRDGYSAFILKQAHNTAQQDSPACATVRPPKEPRKEVAALVVGWYTATLTKKQLRSRAEAALAPGPRQVGGWSEKTLKSLLTKLEKRKP